MSSDRRFNLLCKLMNAGTLEQMANYACELLGNPIFIADIAHTVLAYTTQVDIPIDSWQTTVVQGLRDRNLFSTEQNATNTNRMSAKKHLPLLVEDDDVPYPRIIKALTIDDRIVGEIILTAYLKPLGPDDMELMELISTPILHRVVDEHFLSSDTDEIIEHFLLHLVTTPMSKEYIKKRFSDLSYKPERFSYALAAQWHPGRARVSNGAELRRIFVSVPGCKTFFYNSQLILVCGFDAEISDWASQCPELSATLKDHNMQAGCSRWFTDWSLFPMFVDQAATALHFGKMLGRTETLLPYDAITSYQMFSMLPDENLLKFVHEKIQKLDMYDLEHGSHLCATLQAYLEHARSLTRAAGTLFIHKNTVRYRINKCMEIMGTELRDGREIFSYILSLKIIEYEKNRIKDDN